MAIPRIAVLGSLNIDLVAYVPHHPLPGETLTANSVAVSPGGKGANQAVACAKLSRSRPSESSSTSADDTATHATAHVSMLGAVGDDTYGALLRNNLAAHGVNVAGVSVREGLKTGMAFIVVDAPTGQNRIILSPEANHALTAADVESSELLWGGREDGKVVDLLIMQLEIPLGTVLAALRCAKTASVSVLLNPAPAQALPDEAFAGLAHLVVNETEAAMLGGCEVSVLDDEDGLERVAAGFVAKGVRNVIITLGGRGVYFMSEGGGGERKGLVAAEKATVVDTTAAGDTFVGQYALEAVVAEGAFDIEAAVRKANRASARTVERAGAQDSIPWRDELL
ncbi:Ribokinase-like protein [Podospora appendiculata]|uniref:Ribokinase n=1 Tax=Podospora appendiculata TaxID=314037 RepID=A0AAE0X7W3_9PEZI|nr:Ribokinase-like protein [Podospora appendiculata]